MEFIKSIFSWFVGLGAGGMLPVMIFIICMFFRAPLKKAIRASLMMGIGLTGILTIVSYILIPAITPVINAIAQNLGLKLKVVDIGWGVAGAAWAWPGAFIAIPLFLLINVIMITLKLTRIVWVDIWGFWNFLVIGGIAWAMTNSIPVGIFVTIILMIINLYMADRSADKMGEYFEMPGCAWEVYSCSLYQWTAPLLDKIISAIPGVNKINFDADTIQKKMGPFGEPVIQGFIIGAVLGLISGLGGTTIILTGMAMAGTMVLLPRMVSILMEGIMPLTTIIRDFMTKRFAGREILISLDNATLLGHPSVIASSLIAMPLLLLVAAILPGNLIIPTVSIVAVPWWISSFTAQTKGNIFKMVLMMMFWGALALYASSYSAPGYTLLCSKVGIAKEAIAAGSTVGSLSPADPISFIVYWIISKLGFAAIL